MPEERDIEKQLRAWAGQRRKESGGKVELHPATRRLLQDEAARVHGRRETQESAGKEGLFVRMCRWNLPPLAWVCSALAILAVGAWTVMVTHQKPKSAEMAFNGPTAGYLSPAASPATRSAQSEPARELRSESADNYAKTPGSATDVPGQSFASADRMLTLDTSIRRPAVEEDENLGLVREEVADKDLGVAGAPAETPPPVSAPAAALALATTDTAVAENIEAVTQNYYFRNDIVTTAGDGKTVVTDADKDAAQLAAGSRVKAAKADTLFANFQFQQSGSQVRIIDGDGSVYSGNLLTDNIAGEDGLAAAAGNQSAAEPEAGLRLRKAQLAEAGKKQTTSDAEAVQNIRFTAQGWNQTLTQNVVINANLWNGSVMTNAMSNNVFSYQNNTSQVQSTINGGMWISNGRIIGRAVSDDGREIQLNATQVSQ